MITLSSTRIVVQVAIEDDTGQIAAFLGALALLLGLLAWPGRLGAGLLAFALDLVEAARFTLTVFAIGFKSLAYGFGGLSL